MSRSTAWKSTEGALKFWLFISCWEKFFSIKAMKEKEKYHCLIFKIPGNQTHCFTYYSDSKKLLEGLYNYICTKASGE